MKPGVSAAQAQAELSALTEQLAREYSHIYMGENRKAAVRLTSAPPIARHVPAKVRLRQAGLPKPHDAPGDLHNLDTERAIEAAF
jgi:hypothetical protein